MKGKSLISLIFALLGIATMFYAFLNNSSPYVNVSEAKISQSTNLHLAGDILPGTIHHDIHKGLLLFDVKDEKNEIAHVAYKGHSPANIASITKVVAIGKFSQSKNLFESHKLLLKCPSKYEGVTENQTKDIQVRVSK